MKFSEERAHDVPLLAEQLAPHVQRQGRERLIRYLAEHIVTSILAYCELAPAQPVPQPSTN